MKSDQSQQPEAPPHTPNAATEAQKGERLEHPTFPIVGVGASAGGLEAFSQLLANLPADTGMAFVLVQHLDPKHESKLGGLLASATRMPVREAVHELQVQPDHVYVIPPGTTLSIAKGALMLEPRGEARGPHLPIDHFFRSLADDQQTGAIGVILSGTGTDGTLGLEEIKAAGGITFAQDEQTAKHAGMPQSAARSGCVDLILSPAEIARELTRVGRHPYMTPATTEASPLEASTEKDNFAKILRLLRSASGVDFSAYRDTTVKRRITRRLVLHTKDNLADYAKHLEGNRAELEALFQDILINVTRFFRDPETFEAMKTRVFPEIFANKDPGTPIRIWVPGCSTGQEAYSLVIVLSEFLEDKAVHPDIQIFATDLSEAVSLHKAREGLYPANIEAEVSPERLRRFFTKEDGKYRVSKALRDAVVFAKQNVAADPPFSRVDLITCRNLLIYLAPPLQKRVLPTFHYALNPNGFLVLGRSETIGAFTDLFGLVDPQHRIYAKKPSSMRQYPHFRTADSHLSTDRSQALKPAVSQADWHREADRIAVGQYVPPGVLVNETLDILQFRGQTGPYLTPAPGEPSLNLVKMSREGLFLAARAAVLECQQQGAAVRKQGVRVRSDEGYREINLHVLPVKLPQVGERCYLILFDEDVRRAPPVEMVRFPLVEGAEAAENNQLRQELASTREYLQSVVEQQDAANEELKSANEESLSSNEELQSTNEELETAKEELQSINEELTTVNEQLQSRNVDLGRLNDDMINLLGSSGVPMVVLSIDQCIRRFTPAAGKLLHMIPGDIGRPLGNLKMILNSPDLTTFITEVIDTVQMKEQEVQDKDNHWYALRIHPYRTADNRIDGAVLVLADIHTAKTAQAEVVEARDFAQAVIATTRDPMLVLDANLCVQMASPAFYRTFQVSPRDTDGRPLFKLGNGQWDIPKLRTLLEQILPQNMSLEDFEVSYNFNSIGPKVMLLNARAILRSDSQLKMILLSIEDISERKQAAEALHEADHRKNEFLAMLAHELRNPLAPIGHALQVMRLKAGDREAVQAASEMMERQVGQVVRLVDDLLDISRIGRGKIELRKGRIELASSVNHAVEAAGSLVKSMKQELTVTQPTQPIYLHGDPTRLTQIVGNLLTNACKFTQKGGHIWLTVEQAGQEAVIRVKDNGIGIDAQNLSRIFDMFTQLDISLERSAGGLGIGLTLVKSLVELHGGTVKVQSAGGGHGSEFVVRLPILSDMSPLKPPQPPAFEPLPIKGHRILVVDDNQDAAAVLAMMLELSGNETRIANDGVEALEVASTFRPEVILLDIGLPKLNGHEVARRIREQEWGKSILIVALTGWGQQEDRRDSEKSGFDAHLVKPVEHETLKKMLAGLTSVLLAKS